MRLWAQCPLCSSDTQTLFSVHKCCTQGRLRLNAVMSPVLSGLPQLGCPVVVSYSTQTTLPLLHLCFLGCSLWSENLSCVFLANCPKPSLNLIARATRNLSGLWQVEGGLGGTWVHRTVLFTSLTIPGATLASSQLFCCLLEYLCLTGDQRVVLKTFNLISHTG